MKGSPITAGVLLAIAAAVAFGSTIPFVHRYGADVGMFTTASALYAGSAAIALAWRVPAEKEAPVTRAHLPRIVLVAFFGAVVAPCALAWGLRHSDATSASLLLNFEAVLTVLMAKVFFGESFGGRVWLALLFALAGGLVTIFATSHVEANATWGLAAILLATLAWSLDNTLTRPLANLDPNGVIARKSIFGAIFTLFCAIATRENFPHLGALAVLALCGATGYGLSLRLYLLAQRRVGAARTASVFAIAPFVGAALAYAIGDGRASTGTWLGGAMFALAVYLHLSEKHAHRHHHDALTHEHAHTHDDGHHDHTHDPPVTGSHSHAHAHAVTTHAHPHAPDDHHAHRH